VGDGDPKGSVDEVYMLKRCRIRILSGIGR
jgi:hypothetical protein